MKTHPLNVGYLVVGLVFLGIAGSWLLRETGVIGLVAFAAKGVSERRNGEPSGYGNDDYDSEGDIR